MNEKRNKSIRVRGVEKNVRIRKEGLMKSRRRRSEREIERETEGETKIERKNNSFLLFLGNRGYYRS